jgi:hypothetical protein
MTTTAPATPRLALAVWEAADNAGQGVVYLLHFDRPYRHAAHYTGSTASSGLLKVGCSISDREFGLDEGLVELVGGCRLDVAHPSPGEELRPDGDLVPAGTLRDRRVAGRPASLAGRGPDWFSRRPRRYRVAPAGWRHTPSRVQHSRPPDRISAYCSGFPAFVQESIGTCRPPFVGILSCGKAKSDRLHTTTNCRSVQHWTLNLLGRLDQHEHGRGARLTAVVSGYGIGWQLARIWTGDRHRERQLKRQGGASRRCPLCGIHPRTPPSPDLLADPSNLLAVAA